MGLAGAADALEFCAKLKMGSELGIELGFIEAKRGSATLHDGLLDVLDLLLGARSGRG
jgi:hypothetical protein